MTIVLSISGNMPDYQNILLIRKYILFTVIRSKEGMAFPEITMKDKKESTQMLPNLLRYHS